MSDDVAGDAMDEALAIAAGLPRAEAGRRARQAFESANDIRARLRGLPDAGKRAGAVSRARAWAAVLEHMADTGEAEFCGCLNDGPPLVARVVWIAWDWLARTLWPLNVVAVVQAFGDLFGARPIGFYQWPEPEPGGLANGKTKGEGT